MTYKCRCPIHKCSDILRLVSFSRSGPSTSRSMCNVLHSGEHFDLLAGVGPKDVLDIEEFNNERRNHFHLPGICFVRGAPVESYSALLCTYYNSRRHTNTAHILFPNTHIASPLHTTHTSSPARACTHHIYIFIYTYL